LLRRRCCGPTICRRSGVGSSVCLIRDVWVCAEVIWLSCVGAHQRSIRTTCSVLVNTMLLSYVNDVNINLRPSVEIAREGREKIRLRPEGNGFASYALGDADQACSRFGDLVPPGPRWDDNCVERACGAGNSAGDSCSRIGDLVPPRAAGGTGLRRA